MNRLVERFLALMQEKIGSLRESPSLRCLLYNVGADGSRVIEGFQPRCVSRGQSQVCR